MRVGFYIYGMFNPLNLLLMLLIEKSAVAGNALTGNAFIERVKDSGTIKKNDFKILRLKFFERMV